MKKSKILMPILGSVGTIAAIAPVACLTSCGLNNLSITMEGSGGEYSVDNQTSKLNSGCAMTFRVNITESSSLSEFYFSFDIDDKSWDIGGSEIKLNIWQKGSKTEKPLAWVSEDDSYENKLSEAVSLVKDDYLEVVFKTNTSVNKKWTANFKCR